jgi:WD40 repeat protein
LSLNSSGSEVLTGSWRDTDDALQRWDFGSGKLLKNISWKGEEQQGASSSASASATSASASSGGSSLGGNCMLYAASFSPDDRLIAAGGAGNGINQARLFDAATNTPVERVSFTHAIYALSFAPDSKQLALGGVDSHLTILTL